ncbi:MAG: putative sulfotransferase [Porticoccaceae bacterium]|nr:MAG: putative sulfotransferase [Porticoccaceae bacterium]
MNDLLEAGAIRAQAEVQTGIRDADPATLAGHLEALCGALREDAPLPPREAERIHRYLVARTADRLEAQRWLAEYPEIAAVALDAPVFLTGLPRSGTTFFQYLFDRDSRFRLVRTWQALAPHPPPGFDPASVAHRKAEEAARRAAARPEVPGFAAMHLVDPDGPEECHAFLEQAYGAVGFHNLFDVPSYFAFLRTALDFATVYRVHARQLRLLAWRRPAKRFALKYPGHLVAMPEILAVHPSARFVMTHRDPVQVLGSLCKLTAALRAARYGAVDPRRVGRQMLEFLRFHVDRILAFDRTPAHRRVIHVDYYALLADPAATLSEVLAALDLDAPPEVRAAVAEWARANPPGARGVNPYRLEDYGLHPEEVAERFSDYRERFAIPREAEGLARSRSLRR